MLVKHGYSKHTIKAHSKVSFILLNLKMYYNFVKTCQV